MNEILKFINDAVAIVHSIPDGVWQLLFASGILSPAIKAWHSWRMTKRETEIADWAMILITIGAAFGAVLLRSLLSAYPDSPQLLAIHTALLGFVLTPTYILAVKPLWAYFSKKYGNVSQLEKELQSATIPAAGLPIAGTSVSAADAQAALHAQAAQNQADFTR